MGWGKVRIGIRVNILVNFLTVVLLVSGSLVCLQYLSGRKMALESTRRAFEQVARGVASDLEGMDRLIRAVLYQITLYPGIASEPGREGLPDNAYRFAKTMERYRGIYSINVGYPGGDLFQVINLASEGGERLQAPSGARWAVVRVFNGPRGRIRQWDFWDEGFRHLARFQSPTDYDVRRRPWYIKALKSRGPVMGAPYLFSSLGMKGVTYAEALGSSGVVVALDFTLDTVQEFLQKQAFAPTAVVYLLHENGMLLGASNGAASPGPLILRLLRSGKVGEVCFQKEGEKEKFAMISLLPGAFGGKACLGLVVDASVMLAPYMRRLYYSLVVALGALLMGLPMVFFSTSLVVRPIKSLMEENEKVRHRRFDQVTPVDTCIIELDDLSHSLVAMAKSIQAYQKSLEEMIHSFIKLIAGAIDSKSPYTGGHCRRVPLLALELARAANASDAEPFKSFRFVTDEEWKAFEMGAWLHDCGKITTPEFVVDKATKLETIYNRIHEIRTRFEVLWRDVDIAFYERLLQGEKEEDLERWRRGERRKLLDDFSFVARCNLGSEFLGEEKKERLHRIAQRTWMRHFSNRLGISEKEVRLLGEEPEPPLPVEEPLLADRPEHLIPRGEFDEDAYRKRGFKMEVPPYLYNRGELYNLTIERGTLTPEEIFKIREHVIMTIEMLEQLPYPEGLKNIPEYAGTHHEALNGEGYPRGLKGDQLSIPARIMAIADIFEALTASDRPYKKAKTLSEALKIMAYMVKGGHLDPDLFVLFLETGIYRKYALEWLEPHQVDHVDHGGLLRLAGL